MKEKANWKQMEQIEVTWSADYLTLKLDAPRQHPAPMVGRPI